MLRRLLLAIAVAASATLVAATPAHAHVDTCAWNGNLVTFTTLPAITVGTGPTVDFLFLPWTGSCPLTTTAPLLGGQMTGSVLGTTTGSGATSGGHAFSFTGVAGTLVLAGQAVGTIRMTPDPTSSTGTWYFAQLEITLLH